MRRMLGTIFLIAMMIVTLSPATATAQDWTSSFTLLAPVAFEEGQTHISRFGFDAEARYWRMFSVAGQMTWDTAAMDPTSSDATEMRREFAGFGPRLRHDGPVGSIYAHWLFGVGDDSSGRHRGGVGVDVNVTQRMMARFGYGHDRMGGAWEGDHRITFGLGCRWGR